MGGKRYGIARLNQEKRPREAAFRFLRQLASDQRE
jgi:hypothetical protein